MPDYPKYGDAPSPAKQPGAYPPAGYPNYSGLPPCPSSVGVGGFLLALCIIFTIISPGLSVFWMTVEYDLGRHSSHSFWLYDYYANIRPWVITGLAVLSVLAGIALWTRRPYAVRVAMTYLAASLLNIVVLTTGFFVESVYYSSCVKGIVLAPLFLIVYLVVRLPYVLLAFVYLRCSGRVKATYARAGSPPDAD